MKFELRSIVMLSKDFEIEAENLEDAIKMAERLIVEDVNLSEYEITHIGYDMDSPSIRENTKRICQEILEEFEEKSKTQQS